MNKHIEYLCTRMQKRINFLKAMTSTQAGASGNTLQTLYVTAVRVIVDYSAVCLVMVEEPTIEKLEVLQNQALRLILGAPRWTKVLTMLEETGLLSMKDRLRFLQACYTIKKVKSQKKTYMQKQLTEALPEAVVEGPLTVSNMLAAITNEVLPENDLAEVGHYKRQMKGP